MAHDLDASGTFEAGEQFYYQADHLGSVRAITDAAGFVANSYDYDSYGRIESSTEAVANPFTYTGRELDAESGLYYYRARYYDPATGRFLSEDPIGFAGGDLNPYWYVRNNPTNRVDPIGLFTLVGGVGGSLVGGGGFDVSGGLGVDVNTGDTGAFGSTGFGAGANISVDLFVGLFRGSLSDLLGLTDFTNVTVGPISVTVFFDPITGEFVGFTAGFGRSPLPLGVSAGRTETFGITLRDLLDRLNDLRESLNRDKQPCT